MKAESLPVEGMPVFGYNFPRPDAEIQRFHGEKEVRTFYRHMSELYLPEVQTVVHSYPQNDLPARDIFGDSLRSICQVGCDANVGLWVAGQKGIDNSDFFLLIGDKIRREDMIAPIMTTISKTENPSHMEDVEAYVKRNIARLGYKQIVIEGITSTPDDSRPLARGLFVHKSVES